MFNITDLTNMSFGGSLISRLSQNAKENRNEDERIASYVNWVDYLAIVLYFVIIIIVGIWSSRINKKNSLDGYFLAGRRMHWIPVGASLFASNIGCEHFIGLSGSGAFSGIGISAFEYNAMFVLILLGWYFMPVYLASNVSTMPEYLQKRFGGQRIRVYLAILALILYIFTKISAGLYAGALFIKLLLDLDNIYFAICILLILSAVFTIGGGLTAVIWTDTIQTVIMIGGAITLSIISIIKVGGYNELVNYFGTKGMPNGTQYQAYQNGCNASVEDNCTSCSSITPNYLHLVRPYDDKELPWPGMIFGITISAIWCWCTDQVIVQRALSAKNLSHAKAGCLLASCLKVFPLYILVLPGMAARVLWPNQIGCSDPEYCKKVCDSEIGCTNLAYPYLVIRLMPTGATGLMVSAILAALMSSLTSIFNSASTIFTVDIYTRFRKNATDIEQIIASRFFVLVLVVISVIWIPFVEGANNSQLFQYIQSVTSYLAPPVCAVYLLSVFWARTTEPGVFWALVIGLVIGLARLVCEFALVVPACGSPELDSRPWIIAKVHYLHFGIILFLISTAITVVISLITKPIDEKHLHRLTHGTINSESIREELDQANKSKENLPPDVIKPAKKMNKWLSLICFVKTEQDTEILNTVDDSACVPEEEKAKLEAQMAKDDPKYKEFIDLCAIGMIILAAFFFGYYA